MVQALCRQNGTGPYSRSGSTKAKLAPPSSFSLRPTFPRRPAASSSRPSAPAQQATTTIPISYRGVGAGRSCLRRTGRQSVATRRKYPRERSSSARNSADIWHKLLLGAARFVAALVQQKMGERGNKGADSSKLRWHKQGIQNLSDALYEADT